MRMASCEDNFWPLSLFCMCGVIDLLAHGWDIHPIFIYPLGTIYDQYNPFKNQYNPFKNKTVGFDQRQRPLHSRYTRTGTHVRSVTVSEWPLHKTVTFFTARV
jgi:hypothetical protein